MNLPIKIASRSSPLALAQVEEIIQSLKLLGTNVNYTLLKYETAGDKDKTTPLTTSPDNFFTDAIDHALLSKEADIAIHSAKDLPQHFPAGLDIFALTQCLDNKDAWVGRKPWSQLEAHAKVGTSSLLRQNQILQLRPDVNIVNIRGSITERLQLVKNGQLDGIVVAACALKRLKLEGEISDIFPWEGMPLQGQLAVVGRHEDHDLRNLFSVLDVRRLFLHCGTHPENYIRLGKIIHWPMIDIKAVAFNKASQKQILQAFESSDIIMCTSTFAVDHFVKTLLSIAPDVNFIEKTFAVVGQHTHMALQKYNIKAAIVAQDETARGLLKTMTQQINVKGKRILFPRSSLPNPFLKDVLTLMGAHVTEITIYNNTKPAKRDLPSLSIAGVIFTSPSTVKNFLTDYATIPAHWQIIARGPVTLKTLQEAGYHNATSLS
ncbi:MAG: hydroxymethylbilane synthase [Candidatus Omnitrophica bacterium]|nr:hydroxymethylbilane synthase [Candidatus Omnitrophota bacterium]